MRNIDYDSYRTYPFEYNESEGNFHQNFGDYEQNTKGYRTICEEYDYIWDPFSEWIRKRYNFQSDNRPSFDKVKQEWDWYMEMRRSMYECEKNWKEKLQGNYHTT